MKETTSVQHPLRTRWFDRILDGERSWGYVDIWPPRYGFRKYRLVLFPPGILPADRRVLRAWRAWPVWGAVQWLVSAVLLNALLSPLAAVVWASITWAVTGVALFVVSAAPNAQVRTLSVIPIDGCFDENAATKYQVWKQLSQRLAHADDMVARGQLSRVDHEAIWSRAYDRLQ